MDTLISYKAALLQALHRDGDGYGAELIERVKKSTNGVMVLGQGTTYPVLADLEAGGYLTSRESEVEHRRGGKARIVYHLTLKGRTLAKSNAAVVQMLFSEEK